MDLAFWFNVEDLRQLQGEIYLYRIESSSPWLWSLDYQYSFTKITSRSKKLDALHFTWMLVHVYTIILRGFCTGMRRKIKGIRFYLYNDDDREFELKLWIHYFMLIDHFLTGFHEPIVRLYTFSFMKITFLQQQQQRYHQNM